MLLVLRPDTTPLVIEDPTLEVLHDDDRNLDLAAGVIRMIRMTDDHRESSYGEIPCVSVASVGREPLNLDKTHVLVVRLELDE